MIGGKYEIEDIKETGHALCAIAWARERKQTRFDMLFIVGSEEAVPYFTEMARGKGLSNLSPLSLCLSFSISLCLFQQTLPICCVCPHTFLEPPGHSEILAISNIAHSLMPAYPIAIIFLLYTID